MSVNELKIYLISILLFCSLFGQNKLNYGVSISTEIYDNSDEIINNTYKFTGNFLLKYNINSKWFLTCISGVSYQYIDYNPGSIIYYFDDLGQFNKLTYNEYNVNNLLIPLGISINYHFLEKYKWKPFLSIGETYTFVIKKDKNVDYSWEYDVDKKIPYNGAWKGYKNYNDLDGYNSVNFGLGIIFPFQEKNIIAQFNLVGIANTPSRAYQFTVAYLF